MAGIALITGASGLIGAHLLEQLQAGDLRPEVVDHRRDDLLVPGVPTAVVQRVRPAVIVHLAWVASGTPGYRQSPDNDRWVDASLELRSACLNAGAAFVATGTSLDKVVAPADPYSAGKARLWQELAPEVAAGEITWIRPYYVFDPVRRRPALVEHALAARDVREPVVLRTPESAHDFVHAADVGAGIALAARHGLRGEVPIGSGHLRLVSDLVSALGVDWTPDDPQAAKDSQLHETADIRRLTELGWAPVRTSEFFAAGG
jgi:nucleoside-diphosphate-sugar epimerase